jgi:hypothetical protein
MTRKLLIVLWVLALAHPVQAKGQHSLYLPLIAVSTIGPCICLPGEQP